MQYSCSLIRLRGIQVKITYKMLLVTQRTHKVLNKIILDRTKLIPDFLFLTVSRTQNHKLY